MPDIYRYSVAEPGGTHVATVSDTRTFTDTGLTPGTDYRYEVTDGQDALEVSATTVPLPDKHKFVSNRALSWSDLPTQDSDNGSLVQLSRVARVNVPVRVDDDTVEYQPRVVFTYQANFNWANYPTIHSLSWLVDVLAFKDNQISNGNRAFGAMPASKLTALSDLDTSNLTDMQMMFYRATVFNQPLDFNTRNVTNMDEMFSDARVFSQNISNWCVQQITSKPSDFDVNSGFQNQTHLQPQWGRAC